MRRMRITGPVVVPDGTLRTIETFGPGDVYGLNRCYAVFEAGCILYNLIGHKRLKRYRTKIQSYAQRYPSAWALIFQCDARSRPELPLRSKRQATRDKAKAIHQGTDHDFA